MARMIKRQAKPKVKRRYVLVPREQHRKGGIPVGGHIFKGANVIETEEDLEQWVGVLLVHAHDVPAVIKVPVQIPDPELESEIPTEAGHAVTDSSEEATVRRGGRRKKGG